MAKVIILNGPAGVGKDTIADRLIEFNFADSRVSFKDLIYNVAEASMSVVDYLKLLEAYNDRSTKERPLDVIGGKSPREFFIHISENFIKPVFGSQYFGKYVAASIKKSPSDEVIVMPDGGFIDEIIPMLNDGHSLEVVRLIRAGYSFAGDSRGYIDRDSLLMKYGSFPNVNFSDVHVCDGEIYATMLKVAIAAGLDKK